QQAADFLCQRNVGRSHEFLSTIHNNTQIRGAAEVLRQAHAISLQIQNYASGSLQYILTREKVPYGKSFCKLDHRICRTHCNVTQTNGTKIDADPSKTSTINSF